MDDRQGSGEVVTINVLPAVHPPGPFASAGDVVSESFAHVALVIQAAKDAGCSVGDTDKNISDIARAVGYSSENRFRIAFKQATGLSPKAWRETLRVKHPESA